jgi:hypothetical protein
MRVLDARLPAEDDEDQWGELLFHTAQPEAGRRWADTGKVHEERGLKGRAKDDTRIVPCRPALTRVLREHIKTEGLKPGDLLLSGENGDVLAVGLPPGHGEPLGRRCQWCLDQQKRPSG